MREAGQSTMPGRQKTEWAAIGKIVAPFGIRGELKVLSLSDVPNRFAQLESAYLSPDYTRHAIESVRPYKGEMVLLKLRGIDDPNAAEVLRNCELCIPLDKLAKLPPDSYYQHDIVGLHVFTLDERAVGIVTDIITTGSNDVYVLKAEDGHQVLIPAIKAVVKQIDLIRGRMYIDPMKGLLDDETEADDSDDQDAGEEEE